MIKPASPAHLHLDPSVRVQALNSEQPADSEAEGLLDG